MMAASERRALLTFVVLTFGISWGLGGVCILAFGQPGYVIGKSTSNPLFFLFFGFGPSLAAFITTAVSTVGMELRRCSGHSSAGACQRSGTSWF
jgi:hypothetical protein